MTPHGLRLALDTLGLVYVAPVVLGALWKLVTRKVFPQCGHRSRATLLPPVTDPTARIRICYARGGAFRFFLGGHCFIVYKEHGADAYTRYDYDALGEPIRNHGWLPRDLHIPLQTFVWGADGPRAQQMIPHIERAVRDYGQRHYHDYRKTIGPNSNTFIQGIIDAVPGMDAVLPPNALGKDFPHDGRLIRLTRTGIHIALPGLISLRLGWIEGFELALLIFIAGIDWRRPALKLPALGRIGLPLCRTPPFIPGSGRLPIGHAWGGGNGERKVVDPDTPWRASQAGVRGPQTP